MYFSLKDSYPAFCVANIVDQSKWNTLRQNCKQNQATQFFTCFHYPKRNIGICFIKLLHSQQTMLWRHDVLQRSAISSQSIHFNQKVVAICKLVVPFELWASHFFQEEIFLWRLDYFLEISTMCIVFYSAIFLFASFTMVTFLQADAVFFKDWIPTAN